MAVKLYNTAARTKQIFEPLEGNKVGIYVCGVTVYDLCHIGHARSAIVFDVLVRYLRARGYTVTYVRNFTDVDDKIIDRAGEVGKDTAVLAREYIDAFHEDMERLGVLKADVEPKATDHIKDMIDMIEGLVKKGYAYVEGKDVFFSVEKFNGYGALSGRKMEDMQAGCRVAVDESKRHPMDFVLWKGAKPGEPRWESPWGEGRPGWHIECSAMSNRYLGASFDIHGGGKDLLFPHHENERAQSMCAKGGNFANYWVHNGFVTVESEKMSKSLGNFLTIRDAFEVCHPEVLRLFLLSKHYRTPLDFSRKEVEALRSGLVRIYRAIEAMEEILGREEEALEEAPSALAGVENNGYKADGDSFLEAFVRVMDDDLNTAGAMGLVFEKVKEINRLLHSGQAPSKDEWRRKLAQDRRELLIAGRILGLLGETPQAFFAELAEADRQVDASTVEKLVEERAAARAEKNWAKADEIRDRLKQMGVIVEDGPQGTSWRFDV